MRNPRRRGPICSACSPQDGRNGSAFPRKSPPFWARPAPKSAARKLSFRRGDRLAAGPRPSLPTFREVPIRLPFPDRREKAPGTFHPKFAKPRLRCSRRSVCIPAATGFGRTIPRIRFSVREKLLRQLSHNAWRVSKRCPAATRLRCPGCKKSYRWESNRLIPKARRHGRGANGSQASGSNA